MCLTKTGINTSCCVLIMAMASAPSGAKLQINMVSRYRWRAAKATINSVLSAKLYHGYNPLKRAKHVRGHEPLKHRSVMMAAPGPGGGVLDRPAVLPGYDNKRSTVKKKPPMYRVMLHNDTFNRREYVVRVLMKVVDGLTVDDAVNVMQEAHLNGMACVIECAQEDAERYCEGLRGNGLMASVEPAGGGGEGKPSD
ncbi:hypothetical protein ABBQ32_003834 [Trebouxia sp. C0010 RCD-2024]